MSERKEIVAAPGVVENGPGHALVAGLFVGGQRGRGVMRVRDRDRGEWSPPAFLTLTGGSIGLQIGGQAVDAAEH
jgi:lipid-binding SYLF domain-containing protein